MHRSGLIELDAVIAVARRGSFRSAASALDMSPSALSNAVAGLEQRLGVRLFNRTTRSVSLSAAGTDFVARVAPALSNIHLAMTAARDHQDAPQGLLRINCSSGAAHQILKPLALEFVRRHPSVTLELATDSRMIDIVVAGFDAGIRRKDAIPRDMIALPIGAALRFAVVGSPAYLARHAAPRNPLGLLKHRCIRIRWPNGMLYPWEFVRGREKHELDVPGPLLFDDQSLMLEAALSGAGLAYLSEWVVTEHVAAGRLQRVLVDWMPTYPGLCLYYPQNRHPPAALRAFSALAREARKQQR